MKQWRFAIGAGLLSIVAGYFIAADAAIAIVFSSALALAALLQFGPVILVGAAVVAACCSRVLQAAGFPRIVNFLHFALVLEAVVAVFLRRQRFSKLGRQVLVFASSLLFICLLSWTLDRGPLPKSFLMWLILCEPFLALFALVEGRPSQAGILRFWQVLSALALIQIPIATFQFAVIAGGNPDRVQGTFIGSGAGAHVLGSVCLVGVLFCVSRAVTGRGRNRAYAIAVALSLFVVPLLSDAKQVIVCCLPALLFVIARLHRGSLVAFVPHLVVMALILTCAYFVYDPLQTLSNSSMIQSGVEGKWAGVRILLNYMSRRPGAWLLGMGPGNSVSRIGLMAIEEPLTSLRWPESAVTTDMIAVSRTNYLWASSSVWSSISSWVGIFGDLGPLGLLAYISGLLLVWRKLSRSRTWPTTAAAASLLMAGVLGFFYSWLEEPAFMLVVFAAAALAILAAEEEGRKLSPRHDDL